MLDRVYFARLGSDGPIKIGTSQDVERRLKEVERESGGPVTLLRVEYGGQAVEREFHRRFAAERLHGEWFSPSERLQSYVTWGQTTPPMTTLLEME